MAILLQKWKSNISRLYPQFCFIYEIFKTIFCRITQAFAQNSFKASSVLKETWEDDSSMHYTDNFLSPSPLTIFYHQFHWVECSAWLLFAWLCLQDFKRLFPYLFVTMKNIKQETLSNFLFVSSFLQRKKIGNFFKRKSLWGWDWKLHPWERVIQEHTRKVFQETLF